MTLSRRPELGNFSLSATKEMSSLGGQVLFDGIRNPIVLSPPQFGFKVAKSSHRTSSIMTNPHTLSSVALHFRLSCFRNFLLQLRVNNKLLLYIFDEPYFPYRDKGDITLVQRLPLEVLKEGENEFFVEARQLYDSVARNEVKLKKIRMVFH